MIGHGEISMKYLFLRSFLYFRLKLVHISDFLLIFLLSGQTVRQIVSLNHVNASVHAPPDRSECVSMHSSGIPLSGYFKSFAAKLTAYLMLLSVKSPRQTSSQNEHKKSSIFFVFVQICTTRLPRALTGHPLSAPVMAL